LIVNKNTQRVYLPSVVIDEHILFDLCRLLESEYRRSESKDNCYVRTKLLSKSRELTSAGSDIFLICFLFKDLVKLDIDFHSDDKDASIRINLEDTHLSYFLVSSTDSEWVQNLTKAIDDILFKYRTKNDRFGTWKWRLVFYIPIAALTALLISIPINNTQEFSSLKYITAFLISLPCLYGWYVMFQWLYPKYETVGTWRIKYRTLSLILILSILIVIGYSYSMITVYKTITKDILFLYILLTFCIGVGGVIICFYWLWPKEIKRARNTLYEIIHPKSKLATIKVRDLLNKFPSTTNFKKIDLDCTINQMGSFDDKMGLLVVELDRPLTILRKRDIQYVVDRKAKIGKEQFDNPIIRDIITKVRDERVTQKKWHLEGLNNFALANTDDNLLQATERMSDICEQKSDVPCVVIDSTGKAIATFYYKTIRDFGIMSDSRLTGSKVGKIVRKNSKSRSFLKFKLDDQINKIIKGAEEHDYSFVMVTDGTGNKVLGLLFISDLTAVKFKSELVKLEETLEKFITDNEIKDIITKSRWVKEGMKNFVTANMDDSLKTVVDKMIQLNDSLGVRAVIMDEGVPTSIITYDMISNEIIPPL
jgi:hypothetical protein